MELQQQLDAIVAKWDLNTHPFYESWRAGTLPVDTLRYYAEEYGQLVRLMPSGWSTLDSPTPRFTPRPPCPLRRRWSTLSPACSASPRPR
jgi:hypothetical protein